MLDERCLGALDVLVGHWPGSAIFLGRARGVLGLADARFLRGEDFGLLSISVAAAPADRGAGGDCPGGFGSIAGWSVGALRSSNGVFSRTLSMALRTSSTSLSRMASSNWRWK